jgi:hypothetical protein
VSETATISKADYDVLLDSFTGMVNHHCCYENDKHGEHLYDWALPSNVRSLALCERLGLVVPIDYHRWRWKTEDEREEVTE